ncbi:MAG: protein kinase [Acidobacteria bacterium]|nr:protein kinase [Acidobacteriota bacterium]
MLSNDSLLYNRYKIVRLLAKGGMGAVYEAKDTRLGDTLVAVKETFFSDDKMREAFQSEAILLAKLRHSGLPRVMDHFSEGEGQFLVMEFIEGTDLSEVLNASAGKLTPTDVYDWMAQILNTLGYLHAFDPPIIHRDIKPANIKLTPQGQVILLDFGLAKNQANSLVSGYTVHYAAPEQMTGAGTDARSDLYSLAATVYHLLTGNPPNDTMSRVIALNDSKGDPLKPVNKLNESIPQEIADLLARAMSLDKTQRFLNAAEMFQALNKAVTLDERRVSEAKITGAFPKVSAQTSKLSSSNTEIHNSKADTDPGKNTHSNNKVKTNPGNNSEPKTSAGTSDANATANIDSKAKINSNPNPDSTANKTQTNNDVVNSSEGVKAKSNTAIIGVGAILLVIVLSVLGYQFLFNNDKNPTNNPVTASPSPIAKAVKEINAIEFYMETDNGKQLTGAKPFFLGKDQRFRFHFSPKERGYLYIISPSENNFTTMLTKQPIPETGLESNLVEAGTTLTFPSKGWLRTLGAGYYWTIIFSDKPLEKPKFLAAQAGKQLNEAEQKELEEMVEAFFKEHGKEPVVNDSGSQDKPTQSVLVKEDQVKKGLFIFKLLTE